MFRLVMILGFIFTVSCDVSHLVRNNILYPSSYQSRPIAITRQQQDVSPDGSYQYSYETENGIAAEEHAHVKATGNELEKVAQGSFQWTSPEGELVQVQYVADGEGYRPQGTHIPAIPPAIQRALDWIAAHPQQDEYTQRNHPYGRF